MADTLPNITIPAKQWVDLYDISGVAVGTTVSVENISVCDIYLAVQATQPAVDSDAFTIIQRDNGLVFSTGPGAAGLWAFCNNDGAKVNVRVKGLVVDEPLTAYGERSVAELTPITQITAPYGLLEKVEAFDVLSGTTGAVDSLFFATSGTTADATAAILSRRQVSYRAGQGLLARLTAIFGTPQPDSNQIAGMAINTDSLGFGFDNLIFGIQYFHSGESELQELTITTPAAGSESATITIDGTGFTVPLTAGTVQHNAFEIAVSLNAQVVSFDFSSNNDQVVARSLFAAPFGTFAFSSATAVAAWVQVKAGVVPINDFIPQSTWNIDKRPDLDPFKGNEYQIRMHYQGFGGIEFSIEDRETARLVLVHRIQFANTSTIVSVGNPTFRVGWTVTNGPTNTTSITIKGGSAAGFIEGKVVRTEAPRTVQNTNLTVPVGSFQNIITIRNRLVFGTRRNRAEVFGLSLTAATDSNKAAIVEARIDAVVTGDLDFQFVDKNNSITEIALDEGIVTGGRLVASFFIPSTGGVIINLEELSALLLPGQAVTISGAITAGATAAVNVSVIYQEDL